MHPRRPENLVPQRFPRLQPGPESRGAPRFPILDHFLLLLQLFLQIDHAVPVVVRDRILEPLEVDHRLGPRQDPHGGRRGHRGQVHGGGGGGGVLLEWSSVSVPPRTFIHFLSLSRQQFGGDFPQQDASPFLLVAVTADIVMPNRIFQRRLFLFNVVVIFLPLVTRDLTPESSSSSAAVITVVAPATAHAVDVAVVAVAPPMEDEPVEGVVGVQLFPSGMITLYGTALLVRLSHLVPQPAVRPGLLSHPRVSEARPRPQHQHCQEQGRPRHRRGRHHSDHKRT